jgi:hypothetical protein
MGASGHRRNRKERRWHAYAAGDGDEGMGEAEVDDAVDGVGEKKGER